MKTIEEKMEMWSRITLAAMVVLLLLILFGCTTQYVPVETVRRDSVFLERLQKDSIFVKDSVLVREKGDTVFKDKLRYVYKYVVRKDTVYIERRDSVQVPYPVVKKLTRWQQFNQDMGDALIKAIFIYSLYLLIRWMIKRTRKE